MRTDRTYDHILSSRAVFLLGVALVFVVLFTPLAMGQDSTTTTAVGPSRSDTFPASLGYAAIGAATAVWGTMVTVVGKLWYGRESDRAANQTQIDAIKKEFREEITRLRDRLELEQKERREEAEKLLREQKDIMREVMTTCSAISEALKRNSEAIDRLTQAWKEAGDS